MRAEKGQEYARQRLETNVKLNVRIQNGGRASCDGGRWKEGIGAIDEGRCGEGWKEKKGRSKET